jgi:hypothetical protein
VHGGRHAVGIDAELPAPAHHRRLALVERRAIRILAGLLQQAAEKRGAPGENAA